MLLFLNNVMFKTKKKEKQILMKPVSLFFFAKTIKPDYNYEIVLQK